MRRCLDCDAELTSEQCDNCGLTPAEAGAVLRRRLLNRTAIHLLGAVAFFPVVHNFPPLDLDAMFIFLGVISFLVVSSSVWVDRRSRSGGSVEPLKRVCYGLMPVPWLLAALLLVNSGLDSSSPIHHSASIVGKFSMPGMLRNSRLIVRSWRPGVRYERVPIPVDQFNRFQQGDTIEIRLQNGLLGIPWVRSVDRK